MLIGREAKDVAERGRYLEGQSAGIVFTCLRVVLAALFAYLTFKNGLSDGNSIYAILFALLTLEYVAELIFDVFKK